MKITETIKEPAQISFGSLKIGDVFKIKNDKNYYMKTEKYETSYEDPFDGSYMYTFRNAVCLSNGKIIKVDGYINVIPVDCELIIK